MRLGGSHDYHVDMGDCCNSWETSGSTMGILQR